MLLLCTNLPFFSATRAPHPCQPDPAAQGTIRAASAVRKFNRKEPVMSKKGNKTKGNKEIKKPKQEKPKVLATANSGAGKANLTVGGKSVK
ncbi:MAG: hypothetical protein B7X55_04120 [Rhodobacterales bacterium 34-62-10]|nr:MAG: hypothetical protein B7X55_04120 [Rhodobacterales bacterium 34-62-10]